VTLPPVDVRARLLPTVMLASPVSVMGVAEVIDTVPLGAPALALTVLLMATAPLVEVR
jgi:hypothetical protein